MPIKRSLVGGKNVLSFDRFEVLKELKSGESFPVPVLVAGSRGGLRSVCGTGIAWPPWKYSPYHILCKHSSPVDLHPTSAGSDSLGLES
jgi:hypothetical protein